MIVLNNVSFSYPGTEHPVFQQIHLSIEPLSWLVIAGPDGSGKTTLGKLLKGLLKPDSGSITIEGGPAGSLTTYVGYVGGDPADLFVGTTVEEDVVFGLETLRLCHEEIEYHLRRSLQWVGLSGMEKRLTHTLSGGERQKLALASVLATGARVLILDEAFTMLDRPTTRAMRRLINSLRTKPGLTVIEMTHDFSDNVHVDRVVFLCDHRIGFDGSYQDFLDTPLGRTWTSLTGGVTALRNALSTQG